MEEIRRQFLNEALAALEKTRAEFQAVNNFSDVQKSEVFRLLHTVKGTAQTFGYQTSSRLAHRLESLLARLKTDSANDGDFMIFSEGIGLLIESLKQKDFEIPASFAAKTGAAVSGATTAKQKNSTEFSDNIPKDFLAQLSIHERNTLRAALENGKNLFCLEAGFDLENFADRLIKLRESLAPRGEIIATLPAAKFNQDGKIGFQILLASAVAAPEIKIVAGENSAEIIFDSSPAENNFPMDAAGVLAQIVEHGKALAKKFGKQIEFKTSAENISLAPVELKLVFDVLLHLVRNAADHAFESAGAVKIDLKDERENLRLTVADDGRGVDAERIRQKAIEKNLLAADEILTGQETVDLIFLPELSAKSAITDVSGRGIGLDAVKAIIEKAGGKIRVETERGKGTAFEIILPRWKKKNLTDERN